MSYKSIILKSSGHMVVPLGTGRIDMDEKLWMPGHLVLDILDLPVDALVFEVVMAVDLSIYNAKFGTRQAEE